MFPDIIAKHYVAKAFGGEAMATVSEMVSEIENAFGANVKKLKWMDAVTKKAALKKLSMVTKRVGYPKVFQVRSLTRSLLPIIACQLLLANYCLSIITCQ
jgi:predicted metalloendopeptidase